MSELKETKKMKVVQLHEQSQKHLSNRTPTQKQTIRAKKNKNDPKIKSKSNIRIKRNKENESCSTT